MATQRLTWQAIADHFGCSLSWVERRRLLFIRRGLLTRQGRYHFGDLDEIAKSLREDDYDDYTGREVAQ